MRKPAKSKFDSLTEGAWHTAEEMIKAAAELGRDSSLSQLAKALNVRRVRFQPLLSTAGVTKNDDGFDMVINTEARCVMPEMAGEFDTDRVERADILPPVRFTLAHELAHLVFLKVKGGSWDSDLFRRHERALEHACSRLARMILMPKDLLKRELGNDLFNTENLKRLLSIFRVSPEVLLLRLKLPDMEAACGNQSGLIALVAESSGSLLIELARTWGHTAQERFGNAIERAKSEQREPEQSADEVYSGAEEARLPEGLPLSALGLPVDIDSWLRSGDTGEKDLRVVWRSGESATLPCHVSFLD